MAITAATTSTDRITRADTGKTLFDDAKTVVTSAVSWKQGDLLAFDPSNHRLKVVAATTDGANFCGIADNVCVSGKLAGPYDGLTPVDAAQNGPFMVGPKYDVIATLKLKNGDTFNPGDKVYLSDGDDSQTVTSTDGGDHNHIGIFVGAVITAGASSTGSVKIGSRYPNGTGTALNY